MIRAVICDDEDAALKIITYSIENQGIPIEIVGTASDGKEALALIKKENPNMVFLDIEMPGMNGFDVVEKSIREKDSRALFVFLTSLSSLPLIVPFRMPSGHFAWESAISLKSLLIQIL